MSDDERELVGRLFELVDAPFHGALRALLSENAALKAERDEARRIACSAYAEWRRDLATERNWDCWKKEVDP
jgi:hypothetical protein